MQKQLNNASCILQELNIIDDNQVLISTVWCKPLKTANGVSGQMNGSKSTTSRTVVIAFPLLKAFLEWFLKNAHMVKSGEKSKCSCTEKMSKWRMCMNHDMMKKLEKHFGKLKDLEKATGLQENQLLPLVQKLLHEQMEGMMDM